MIRLIEQAGRIGSRVVSAACETLPRPLGCGGSPRVTEVADRARHRAVGEIQAQLHFDLLVLTKLCTELTTLPAATPIAAIWVAEGLDGSALTAVWRASTDDFTALVWVGKSLLASLTSVVASLSIVVSCDFRPLIPLLVMELGRFLTEFSRLVRAEQYAGLLLLPQPAIAINARALTAASAQRTDPVDLTRLVLSLTAVTLSRNCRHGIVQNG